MSNQSPAEINKMIQNIRPKNDEMVRHDINEAVHSSISNLILRIAPYYDKDGASNELLCLFGTVACEYKGSRYNIPIEIWLRQDHPNVPPIVYVKPTSNMHVSPTSKDVLLDGTIIIPYLKNWQHPQSDLITLLKEMSDAFGRSSPVYTNANASYSFPPYPTPTHFRNSNVFPPFLNASTSTPNTFLTTIQSATSNAASTVVDSKKPIHRFSDIAAEPRQMLPPIQGFETAPLVSLEDAVAPLASLIPDVENMARIVKENCTHPKDGLSPDESASIMLYTLEWTPHEKSFYVLFNAALRAANRQELDPWFSYLRLFTSALQKLPSNRSAIVHRGVKLDLTDKYCQGDTIVWWGFSSCAPSIETLSDERFFDERILRTRFDIVCDSELCKNIRSHSYSEEDEIALLPGHQFQVIGYLNQGNGLQVVQLKETKPESPLIELPS